jgi:opacity protein-like surface antigen
MSKRIVLLTALAALSVSNVFAEAYFALGPVYNAGAADHIYANSIAPRWAFGIRSKTMNYAAVEVFADYPYGVLHDHNPPPYLSIKPKVTYGLSVLPSIKFDECTLGYLRVGGVLTRFPSYDTSRKGYQLGLGIEYALSTAFSVRGEYDYINYQVLDDVGKPRANQAAISLLYRLDESGPPCAYC